MKRLQDHVAENGNTARGARQKRRRNREATADDVEPRAHRPLARPRRGDCRAAGGSRADRMNSFWRALVEFQHRDVLVVAICADDAR